MIAFRIVGVERELVSAKMGISLFVSQRSKVENRASILDLSVVRLGFLSCITLIRFRQRFDFMIRVRG